MDLLGNWLFSSRDIFQSGLELSKVTAAAFGGQVLTKALVTSASIADIRRPVLPGSWKLGIKFGSMTSKMWFLDPAATPRGLLDLLVQYLRNQD